MVAVLLLITLCQVRPDPNIDSFKHTPLCVYTLPRIVENKRLPVFVLWRLWWRWCGGLVCSFAASKVPGDFVEFFDQHLSDA